VIVESTILVPTLEDAATLGPTLEELNRIVVATGVATEVIVVDAGSEDGTLAVASEMADRLPLLHMRILVTDRQLSGFGRLVRLGLAYAQGHHCFIVMPDARDPLGVLPDMLGALRRGTHLVLCSRFEDKAGERALPSRFRLYQRLYRRAIRAVLGEDIPDSTYGFRGFNRTFMLALGLTAQSFAVCPEITFKVLLAGGDVQRVPGVPTGPMLETQGKFRLRNELGSYALVLARAGLHKRGWLRWF
jgi:glycosyltransferase involved in cell wall biosynthesis